MRKTYFILVALLVLIILFISQLFYWFKVKLSPISTSKEKISFIVEKGKSAGEIGEELYQKNLIRSSLVFKLYVQFLDKSKNINAGEFELSPSMSVSEIVNTLGKGPKELWVTIPEGLRREEVVDRIIQALEIDESRRESFRSEFLSLSKSSEGYLFPDTYLFPRDASAETIYKKLRSTFDEKFESSVMPLMQDSRYSKNDIVIMASMLERETKTFAERPLVAGILWKRIENDWPLQVDASVQYAVASVNCQVSDTECDWWPDLTLEDLNIKSQYNTYKYKGLPPAPLCNPGLSSLQSSAKPEMSDYWFYLHSADGQIHYAKTVEEHSANVRKYLNK